MTIDETEKSNLQIKYTLKGKEINLIDSDFTLYFTGRPEIKVNFSLIDLGIDMLSKYYLKLPTMIKLLFFAGKKSIFKS